MTVSYTFNNPGRVAESTRLKVVEAAERLGFRGPDAGARQLRRRGGLRSLGLVLGESLDYIFDDPEATRFVAGIARECTRAGFGLTFIPTTGTADDVELIASAAVDAFIVWTTTPDDVSLAAVRDSHRPAVIHGGPATEGFTLVSIDNRSAAEALAMEVWSGGSHPVVLCFPLDRSRDAGTHYGIDAQSVAFPVSRDRLAGCQDAAQALGIDWQRIPIIVCAHNSAEEGRDRVTSLLGTGAPVDGIVSMSDQLAVGAMEALKSLDLPVPQDVTVGGFDDSVPAREWELTTVHQSLLDQGARAARIALGVEKPGSKQDEWRLIRRRSSFRL